MKEDKTERYSYGKIWSMPSDGDVNSKPINQTRTSRKTIFICSIILLGLTAALTTWVFVVRPNFYPKLKIMNRSADDGDMEKRHHIGRRSGNNEVGSGIGGAEVELNFIDSEPKTKSDAVQDESGSSDPEADVGSGDTEANSESEDAKAVTWSDDVEAKAKSDDTEVDSESNDAKAVTWSDDTEAETKSDDVEAEARSTVHHSNHHHHHHHAKTRKNSSAMLHGKSKLEKIFVDVSRKEDFPHKGSRLPRTLLPLDYYLRLDVDLNKEIYDGDVSIDMKCVQDTNYVVFHSRKLKIKHVDVGLVAEPEKLEIKRILFYEKYEMYYVEIDGQFRKGHEYTVFIEFETSFSDYLAGLYKSQYKAKNGEFRTVATSHFEPTDARRGFPCLDEPDFKATFHIRIVHSAAYTALSNMPVKDTKTVGQGKIEDTFQPSVKISTYLVAFAIVDFKYKESKTDSGVKVRVYAPETDYDRIDYALKAGTTILSFYEKFFGAPYPLPKLDLLAVPDFLAGAMEDWGLVSFRNSYLIFEENMTTTDQKKLVALVIAHELAHQWFGNLVTMKWWNDIWLNEGFANFVEMLGTNEVNKKFRSLDLQVPFGWQTAIALDSMQNSHPIDQEVDTPSEIDELFDAISYNKGAALLRMLNSFLGKDFIKGVKSYIQANKFSNAETDDLWRHLQKADHTNRLEIKNIMDTWSKQSGFPVLTIKRDGEDILVSQKSILLEKAESHKKSKQKNIDDDGDDDKPDQLPQDSKWHVPFTYLFDKSTKEVNTVWLNNETQIRVKAPKDFKWMKANVKNHGFYVVNYDKATWLNLIHQLRTDHKASVFSPVDRAGLIHDAFKLGCDGIISPAIPLKMSKYLVNEKHYLPWAMARSKLDCMTLLMDNKKSKKLYKEYFWELQSHLVDVSMLDPRNYNLSKPLDIFQRYDTFTYALKYDFRKDFKKILSVYFDEMKKGNKVPGMTAELRALTLIFGFDAKKDDDFNFLWKTYIETPRDADRRFIMKAFSRVKDRKKLKVILDESLDPKKVRVQDTIPLMMTLVKTSPTARHQVWNFIKKNFDKLAKRYGGRYQLGSLVVEVVGGFCKKSDYKQVKKFLSKHSLGEKGSRTERLAIEKIKNNMDRQTSSISSRRSTLIEAWVVRQLNKINEKKQEKSV
eukprot:gene4789-5416_t